MFGRKLKLLRRNAEGNTSVIAALVLVPALLAVGVAIDYDRISDRTTSLQAALDTAVLASAASGKGLSTAEARKYFDSNAKFSDVTIKNVVMSKNADGEYVGNLSASMQLGLTRLAGLSSPDIDLVSSAKAGTLVKADQVTFQITNAQGAFDKEIHFITKDKDGKVIKDTKVLDYDYSYSGGIGTKKFTPALTSNITLSAGDYATYAIVMVVFADTTYTGKRLNPKSFASDDPKAASWTKTSGTCATGQTQNWEDGGDSNYLDFIFKLTCTTKTTGGGLVRLTH